MQSYMMRIGLGIDSHRFEKLDKPLMIGGIIIPYHLSLNGHSDADVLLHALVDAILGALSLGDIGDYFPPSDNKWKNASSTIFLDFAKEKLDSLGYKINNIDCVIMLEAPKLLNYKQTIKHNIAKLLAIPSNICNIKATTGEKMGYIGRKEGIEVHCIVLLEKKNNNI